MITIQTPLVSVITSFHNEERYLRQAVESVLAQTHKNLEIILIDDYSNDGSLDICRSFRDPRIQIYSKTDEPRYLAASRNLGIRKAKGEFVAFQDADDLTDPCRIEKQLDIIMGNPLSRVVGCWVRRIENDVEQIMAPPASHQEIVQGFHRTYRRTTIIGGTILAPRRLLLDFPYREQFKYMQDWDHLLRLYESHSVEFRNVPEPLYTYFIRPSGVLNDPEWLDYNIFVRHCQHCRRAGRPECETLEAFRKHLDAHPREKFRWIGLRELIRTRKKLHSAFSRRRPA